MLARRIEPLDGGHLGSRDSANRSDARSRGASLHMDRAGAAEANPATEFSSREAQFVADHPEQRRVTRAVRRNRAAIEIKGSHDRIAPVLTSCQCDADDSRRIAETFFSKSLHGGYLVRVRRR